MERIKRALIVAAGFGTRFLPASKAIPKVMFPVVDKPIVQYVVEELSEAGIKEIVFVLSPFTQDVREHFESFPALNALLEKSGKQKQIEELKRIENLANFFYTEQRAGRHGIGVAVLSAKEFIKREPFILAWADDFFKCQPCRFSQLLQVYEQLGGSILGCVRTTNPKDGLKYGFITGEKISPTVTKLKDIIEKPGEGKAPSDLASLSGMILQPEIFDFLEELDRKFPPEKELYHVDGIKRMIEENMPVYGLEYQNARYFDTGDKFGYLKTMVELGLENEELGASFRQYLQSLNL